MCFFYLSRTEYPHPLKMNVKLDLNLITVCDSSQRTRLKESNAFYVCGHTDPDYKLKGVRMNKMTVKYYGRVHWQVLRG